MKFIVLETFSQCRNLGKATFIQLFEAIRFEGNQRAAHQTTYLKLNLRFFAKIHSYLARIKRT